jgi:hypothetical protein
LAAAFLAGAALAAFGAAAGAGAEATAGAAVFLAGIFVFDLMAELEVDISNAVVILLVVLTCLNHNLTTALTIMKHTG